MLYYTNMKIRLDFLPAVAERKPFMWSFSVFCFRYLMFGFFFYVLFLMQLSLHSIIEHRITNIETNMVLLLSIHAGLYRKLSVHRAILHNVSSEFVYPNSHFLSTLEINIVLALLLLLLLNVVY